MALPSFAPTGAVSLSATGTSASVVLPTAGTPITALVTNVGGQPVFVSLGAGGVVATQAGSLAVMPGDQIALTIGTATNLAAIAPFGGSGLNIAVGT